MHIQRLQLGRISLKVMFLSIIFVCFLGGAPNHAQAGVWGYDEANAWAIEVFDVLKKQIENILVGVAKQAVAQIMNTQITTLIGGGGGKGVMFITNWQSFLVNDPQKQVHSFMNDFFSMTTLGRNSSSRYQSAPAGCESHGFRGTLMQGACVINSGDPSTRIGVLNNDQKTLLMQEGIIATANAEEYTISRNAPAYCGQSTTYSCAQAATSCASLTPSKVEDSACQAWCGTGQKYCAAKPATLADTNYYKYQQTAAEKAINPMPCKIDLLDYVTSSAEAFTSWRGLNAWSSNPCNNSEYAIIAKGVHDNQLAQERHLADIQAIAYQGFKASVGSDGVTVKTPGITVGQLVSKVQGFSFDSIASAQGIGAIIESVATTVINAVVTKGINMAVGAVQDGVNSATGGRINFNLQGSSLANINWNNSGAGQSAEFNNGINNFNSDAQSGLINTNQTWGNMNFSGANTNTANNSNQNSYSTLNSDNFQGLKNTGNLGSSPDPFVPNTTWKAQQIPQSNDPLWNGAN